jgi:hypothetical protein
LARSKSSSWPSTRPSRTLRRWTGGAGFFDETGIGVRGLLACLLRQLVPGEASGQRLVIIRDLLCLSFLRRGDPIPAPPRSVRGCSTRGSARDGVRRSPSYRSMSSRSTPSWVSTMSHSRAARARSCRSIVSFIRFRSCSVMTSAATSRIPCMRSCTRWPWARRLASRTNSSSSRRCDWTLLQQALHLLFTHRGAGAITLHLDPGRQPAGQLGGAYLEDSVRVYTERHFDLGEFLRHGRNAREAEPRQRSVLGRHGALAPAARAPSRRTGCPPPW